MKITFYAVKSESFKKCDNYGFSETCKDEKTTSQEFAIAVIHDQPCRSPVSKKKNYSIVKNSFCTVPPTSTIGKLIDFLKSISDDC